MGKSPEQIHLSLEIMRKLGATWNQVEIERALQLHGFSKRPPLALTAHALQQSNGERIESTSRCNRERHPLGRFAYGSAALASVLALLADFTFSNQSQHPSRMMHTVDAAFEI